MKKSDSERKARQRKLNAAGIVHAAGWIKRDDAEGFCQMLKRAEADVKGVEDDRNPD